MKQVRRTCSLTGLMVLGYYAKQTERRAGAACMKALGIKSGTLYPILRKLSDQGFLIETHEEGDPAELGRPLYVWYEATSAAREFVKAKGGIELAEWAMRFNIK